MTSFFARYNDAAVNVMILNTAEVFADLIHYGLAGL
jgi:hypothetical protein